MSETKQLPEHGEGKRFCNCNLCFAWRIKREREQFGEAGVDQMRRIVGLPPLQNETKT